MSGADWLLGLGMVLMLEGMLPFLSPEGYRNLLTQLLTMPDTALRWGGLIAMSLGLGLMYLAR